MASKSSGGDTAVWFFIVLVLILMGSGVSISLNPESWFQKSEGGDYSRDAFGPAWSDVDHNGCDTRNDILQRDLDNKQLEGNCTVLKGTLDDPYTGKTIAFTRGKESSMAVQIDHIVPLSYAWQTGANKWNDAKRAQFANDPSNLLAVDGPTNGKKSDKGLSDFLPPDTKYQCKYVQQFKAITEKYQLELKAADIQKYKEVSAKC